VVDQLILKFLA